ncbi:MAG: tetratricopeptide repeat protein [Longimicrobiaceae bacterium]
MPTPFLSSEEFDERAHQLYQAGKYNLALKLLRAGLFRYPDSADLWVGMGYVRVAREEFAWAAHCFAQAVQLDPGHEDGWVGRGEMWLRFGQFEHAEACFGTVDELGLGAGLETGMTIGRALYREGFFQQARERFEGLARVHPSDPEPTAGLGYTLYALGEHDEAQKALRRALEMEPELHDARVQLSHLLHERGDPAGALRELELIPADGFLDADSVNRCLELRRGLYGPSGDARELALRARLGELEGELDEIDRLLAEVEAGAG